MSETQRWLTNSQMHDALVVFEDLLQKNGQAAVLRLSGLDRYIDQPPPKDDRPEIPRGDLSSLFSGVVGMFGEQGARGVLRRWGRAYAVKRLETHVSARLLRIGLRLARPAPALRTALARLLPLVDLAREGRSPITAELDDHLVLQFDDCVYCPGGTGSQPNCPTVVGLLEGLLRWSTGRDYDVSEESPAAPGSPVLKIRKRPLERR